MARLRKEGSWSDDSRATWPTDSLPNWIALLSSADSSVSGIHGNDHRPQYPRVASALGPCSMPPSVLHALRRLVPSATTAVFHDWPPLNGVFAGARSESDAPFLTMTLNSDSDVAQHAEKLLVTTPDATFPTLSFVYFIDVDEVGHHSGYGPAYSAAMAATDAYVGRLLAALDARPSIRAKTAFIVVSDHGRDPSGTRHGAFSQREMVVSWLAWSPGNIRAGRTVTPKGGLSNLDTAPTILFALGLHVVIDQWRGRIVTDIFTPAFLAAHPSLLSSPSSPSSQSLQSISNSLPLLYTPPTHISLTYPPSQSCLDSYILLADPTDEILHALHLRPFYIYQFITAICIGIVATLVVQVVAAIGWRVLKWAIGRYKRGRFRAVAKKWRPFVWKWEKGAGSSKQKEKAKEVEKDGAGWRRMSHAV